MNILLGMASLVIIVAGLRAGASLLIPLVFALFLAVLCYPSVQTLQRRRVPGIAAVGLTVTTVFILLIGPGLLVVAAVRQFVSAVPVYQERLVQMTNRTIASARDGLPADWLPADFVLDSAQLPGYFDPARAFDVLVNALSGFVTLLSVGFLIVFVTAFMLLEGTHRGQHAAAAMGPAARDVARIIREMQIYLQVKTLVSLLTGLAAGLWLTLLGVDFALLWGLTAFLLNFIPNLGSIAAVLPPALVALIQFGPSVMALVLLGYLALNALLGTMLEPFLLGRQLRISPLAVFLSVIIWGWIWGVAGALLAMPMTMGLKIVLEQSKDLQWIARLIEGSHAPAPAVTSTPGSEPL
jgi:predicted PurR-regulated permease PerM